MTLEVLMAVCHWRCVSECLTVRLTVSVLALSLLFFYYFLLATSVIHSEHSFSSPIVILIILLSSPPFILLWIWLVLIVNVTCESKLTIHYFYPLFVSLLNQRTFLTSSHIHSPLDCELWHLAQLFFLFSVLLFLHFLLSPNTGTSRRTWPTWPSWSYIGCKENNLTCTLHSSLALTKILLTLYIIIIIITPILPILLLILLPFLFILFHLPTCTSVQVTVKPG